MTHGDGGRVVLGQRVWVADPAGLGGRAFGRIASLPPVFLSGSPSFVVLLDGKNIVVTCCEERRGSQWDFAEKG